MSDGGAPEAALARLASDLDAEPEHVLRVALGALGGLIAHARQGDAKREVRLRRLDPHDLRVEPRREERIQVLRQAYRELDQGTGTGPPPVLVSGPGIVHDGNHRCNAARRLGRRVDALVVADRSRSVSSRYERVLERMSPSARARHERVTRACELRRELRAIGNRPAKAARTDALRRELATLEARR